MTALCWFYSQIKAHMLLKTQTAEILAREIVRKTQLPVAQLLTLHLYDQSKCETFQVTKMHTPLREAEDERELGYSSVCLGNNLKKRKMHLSGREKYLSLFIHLYSLILLFHY